MRLAFPFATLLLAGCLAGPDYQRPSMEPGPDYATPRPEAVGLTDRSPWWTGFGDPVLDALVAEGLSANLGLAAARSRTRAARALIRGQTADLYPRLDGETGGSASYEEQRHAPGNSTSSRDAGLGLVLDWTLDLFGGQRRAVEAAEAEAERLVWAERDAALVVVSEIARTYLDLRGREHRLVLARESLVLQERTLEIVRGRVEAGLAPRLDLDRALAAVETLRADLPPLRRDIRRDRDTLAVLVGRRPGTLGALLPEGSGDGLPGFKAGPPLGLPLDLLRRRPDLRQAEAALKAASAEIGVAEAALYPSLRLPGRLSLDLSGYGTDSLTRTMVATLSATLDIPLFDAGGRRAAVDAARAAASEALHAYRAALLNALQAVESAIHGYRAADNRIRALEVTVQANSRAYDRARALYTQGLTGFIDVLDAQRALTASRQDLTAARTDRATALVTLYQAAGLTPGSDTG